MSTSTPDGSAGEYDDNLFASGGSGSGGCGKRGLCTCSCLVDFSALALPFDFAGGCFAFEAPAVPLDAVIAAEGFSGGVEVIFDVFEKGGLGISSGLTVCM